MMSGLVYCHRRQFNKKCPVRLLVVVLYACVITSFSMMCGASEEDASLYQQVQNLERELATLKSDDDKEHATVNAVEAAMKKIQISGFASIDAEQLHSNSDGDTYAGAGTHLGWGNHSVVGLQMQFNMSDATNFIFQVTSRFNENNKIVAEWAYLTHHFDEHWQVRVGTMRLPFFLSSEYLEVGFAYPWANLPTEVYGGTLDNFTGGDVGYHWTAYTMTFDLQAYVGTHLSTKARQGSVGDVKVDGLTGMRWDGSWNAWRLGASYTEGRVTAEGGSLQPFVEPRSKASFVGLGLGYEGEQLLLQTEWVEQKVAGAIADEEAYHVSGAYHMGKWTPYAIYAHLRSIDNNERLTPPDNLLTQHYMQSSLAFGLRRDVFDNLALKGEVLHVLKNEHSDRIVGDVGDSAYLYTLKLDVLF